jgi:hypothetical protein
MSLIDIILHPIVDSAGETIVHRTLFEDPFPTSNKLSDWINDAWKAAFDQSRQQYERCSLLCRREVCRALSTSLTRLQTLTMSSSCEVAIGALDPNSSMLSGRTLRTSSTLTAKTQRRCKAVLIGCYSRTGLPALIERYGLPRAS